MAEFLSPLDLEKHYSESSLPLLKFQQKREKNQSYDTAESDRFQIVQKKERCICFKKIRGLLFMLLCVVFIDFTRFVTKLSFRENEKLSAMQQAFGKFTAMNILVFLIAITVCKLRATLCSIPRFLLCKFLTRCFIFTAVSVLQAFGIKMLTYSTSVVLSFTAPLLTPFTAFLILRERITLCNIMSLLICFAGVIIFTNPSFFGEDESTQKAGEKNSLLGIILMLGSAVARAFDITLMKMLNNAHALRSKAEYEDQHYVIKVIDTEKHLHVELAYDLDSTSLNQFSVLYYLSLVGSFVGAICFGVEQAAATYHEGVGFTSGETLLLILASSAFLLMSQYMYSLATKYEDVSKLASVFYFQIVLAFIWQAFVFKGDIGIAEILGTAIILFTSLTVALQKLLK